MTAARYAATSSMPRLMVADSSAILRRGRCLSCGAVGMARSHHSAMTSAPLVVHSIERRGARPSPS
jgi:hypothetical protein